MTIWSRFRQKGQICLLLMPMSRMLCHLRVKHVPEVPKTLVFFGCFFAVFWLSNGSSGLENENENEIRREENRAMPLVEIHTVSITRKVNSKLNIKY